MTEEIWKDISEFDGVYQVSNLGNVRSVKRTVKYSNGRLYEYDSKILKQTLNAKRGYKYVNLSFAGKRKNLPVHRLVAKAFVNNSSGAEYVNHIDGNKLNNISCNLEWVTAKDNSLHAVRLGLIPSGEKHYSSKFTNSQIVEFRKNFRKGIPLTSLAIMGGVGVSTMHSILYKKTYKGVVSE